MQAQVTTYQWLQLPIEVRHELKRIFNIPRSSGTRVEMGFQNVVLSDGHTHQDLSVITVEKMQAWTCTEETDFFKLFELTLAKIEANKIIKEEEDALKQSEIDAKDDEEQRKQAAEVLLKVGSMADQVIKKKIGRPPKIK